MAAPDAGEPDLVRRAREAFVDDDLDLAVDLYSQAIDVDPENATLLADRAQAHIKLENFTEAVADANKAIQLDPSMAKAYLRKATACMKLEEYQTAKAALEAGAKLNRGDSRFTKLIKECDDCIAEENSDLPTRSSSNIPPTSNVTLHATDDNECEGLVEVPAQSAVVLSKPKYRHDYYNSPTEVVLTIFAKGIPSENVQVEFGEQTLSVVIDVPDEEPYHFQPRLFGKITPEKCRYHVLSTKVEIRMWKADAINWTSLEYSDKKKSVQPKSSSVPAAQKPSYPSSKSKTDWDKLVAQVKKEEKDEKLDGDAALNKFFRDIYRDSDEDIRRAMSKSFVESNGTVLSTNWKDVGARKVESTPPDGMELKKWEY